MCLTPLSTPPAMCAQLRPAWQASRVANTRKTKKIAFLEKQLKETATGPKEHKLKDGSGHVTREARDAAVNLVCKNSIACTQAYDAQNTVFAAHGGTVVDSVVNTRQMMQVNMCERAQIYQLDQAKRLAEAISGEEHIVPANIDPEALARSGWGSVECNREFLHSRRMHSRFRKIATEYVSDMLQHG